MFAFAGASLPPLLLPQVHGPRRSHAALGSPAASCKLGSRRGGSFVVDAEHVRRVSQPENPYLDFQS